MEYRVYVGNELRLRFAADLSEASASVEVIDDDVGVRSTPLQTADGCHDPDELAQIINDWLHSEGGAAFGDDESIEVIASEP